MHSSVIFALLGGAGSAVGHMFMSDPAPLRGTNNPHAGDDVDYEMKSPISAEQFPCRGSLGLLGTEAGAPTAEYKAGQSYSATIEGGAAHGGGSCQFSLSYDKGNTWKVIQSIIGDCPVSGGSSFDFTIPADAPSSDEAIFSWSWNNKIGNREFYQNCAVVSISGGSSKARRADEVAFDSLPDMFVANIVDDCSVPEGIDVLYPDPGPNVKKNTEGTPPDGSGCAGAGSGGGGSGGAPAPSSGAPAPSGGASPSTDGGEYSAPASSEPARSAPTVPAAQPSAPAESASAPASSAPAPSSAAEAPTASMSVEPQVPTSLVVIPIESSQTPSPSPGGVFVTAPSAGASGSAAPSGTGAASGSAAPTGSPTTLATSAAAPSGTDAPSTGGSSGEQSGACEEEGSWNCVGGSQFQRCASGQWSQLVPMSEGTTCEEGVSSELKTGLKRFRFFRRN